MDEEENNWQILPFHNQNELNDLVTDCYDPSLPLHKTYTIDNQLPYDVTVGIQKSIANQNENEAESNQFVVVVQSGHQIRTTTDRDAILLLHFNYLDGQRWMYSEKDQQPEGNLEEIGFQPPDRIDFHLRLGERRFNRKRLETTMELYSPLWMVNRTGFNLICLQKSEDVMKWEIDLPVRMQTQQPVMADIHLSQLFVSIKDSSGFPQEWIQVECTDAGIVFKTETDQTHPLSASISADDQILTFSTDFF